MSRRRPFRVLRRLAGSIEQAREFDEALGVDASDIPASTSFDVWCAARAAQAEAAARSFYNLPDPRQQALPL